MTLNVESLHIEYPGQLVFDDVSFDVPDNKIVAIQTHVLDGGTSLLRGLGGFLIGVGGRVMLNGTNLLDCDPAEHAMRVGYVYEQHGLVSLYTVYQNIILPLQFHTEMTEDSINTRLAELCKALGLDESLLGQRPYALNDVQSRIVNLARALIIEPDLLLVDELEGGMSEAYLEEAMATLRQKQEERSMIVLITTGNDFVLEKADLVYRIEDYNVVAEA